MDLACGLKILGIRERISGAATKSYTLASSRVVRRGRIAVVFTSTYHVAWNPDKVIVPVEHPRGLLAHKLD